MYQQLLNASFVCINVLSYVNTKWICKLISTVWLKLVYILKQWIALKVHRNWLTVTPNILGYLPPSKTNAKMASRFASVTSEEIIQINFLWCILSHCFSIYSDNYSPPCRWLATDTHKTRTYFKVQQKFTNIKLGAMIIVATPSYLPFWLNLLHSRLAKMFLKLQMLHVTNYCRHVWEAISLKN